MPPGAPPPRDPYEQGFETVQRRRAQLAAGGVPSAPYQPQAKPPPRPTWRWLLAAIALVIVVAGVRGGLSSHPPALRKSCTTPAFALSGGSVKVRHLVRWSVTGPPGTRFALAVGVASFTLAPSGKLLPVADGPHPTQVVTPVDVLGRGCTGNGAFGVSVPAGRYAVRMFVVTGHGATAAARPVATKTLVVTR